MKKTLASLPLVKGGLPWLGNILQLKPDKLHLILEDWTKEYGEFYRLKVLGKDVVVVCDYELIVTMLKNRMHPYSRPDNFVVTLKELKIDSLFTNDINEWEVQRNLVTQSMNINKLRGSYARFEEITCNLINHWNEKSDNKEVVDLVLDARKYTFDMLSAVSLGYNDNSFTSDDNRFFHAMDVVFEVMNKGAQAPFLIWRQLYTKYNKNVVRSVSLVVSKIEEIIQKNLQCKDEGADVDSQCNILYSMIIENENSDKKITSSQLVGNTFALIGAGFHTVGNTISWLSYNFARHPELQERLHREAMDYIQAEGEPDSFHCFSKLPLANAFIKESMRLRPSAPLIFITTTDDVELGGVSIPKGTDIYGHTGYLSRCDKHFKDANVFNIDRWLEKSLDRSEHNEKAYMPFSNGSTFCPGRNLAFLQVQIYLFDISRRFKLTLDSKSKNVEEHYHIGVEPSDILLNVQRRA